MFFGDHNPPDFHVRYSGHKARVGLDGQILDGTLPRRAARLEPTTTSGTSAHRISGARCQAEATFSLLFGPICKSH